MNKKNILGVLLSLVVIGGLFVGCEETTDDKQAKQTEQI
jgi:hypothetical protein